MYLNSYLNLVICNKKHALLNQFYICKYAFDFFLEKWHLNTLLGWFYF